MGPQENTIQQNNEVKEEAKTQAQPAEAQKVEQSTAVMEKPGTDLASPEKIDSRGFDEPDDKDDLIIPRMKLLQGLSPEVRENPRMYIPGMLIDHVTLDILNTDESGNVKPIDIIPLIKSTEWIRFNPQSENEPGYLKEYEKGEIIWRTKNPDDPRTKEAKFGPNGEKPVANKIMTFLAFIPGNVMPLVISFSKSSFNTGKKLFTMAKRHNMITGKPMFSRKYELSTKQDTNDGHVYYIFDVKNPRDLTPDEYTVADRLYESFKEKEIVVDYSDAESNEPKDAADQKDAAWAE